MSGMAGLSQQRWYKKYRDRLDAREVLEHYGAINITEQPGGDGTTELIHSCLIDRVEPHHSHGDANPSAACNVDRKLYYCYASRWKGDLLHLVMKMENKESFSESLLSASELFRGGVETDHVALARKMEGEWESLVERLRAESGGPSMYSVNLPSYDPAMMRSWRWPSAHPYLIERGITQEAYDLLELGYDERECRVTFPHYIGGKLVGFQKRTVPPRLGQWPGTVPDMPKYRSSSGFPKAESLYGYDRARAEIAISQPVQGMRAEVPLVVVESPMSVAKAYSFGFYNVVATFGAAVTDEQLRLLTDFNPVIVWFDDDESGRKGERRIAEGLRVDTVSIVPPDHELDMADCVTADELRAKLSSAVPGFLRRAQYETEYLQKGMSWTPS